MSSTTVCANCGVSGHYYKDCKIPISSYGLVCFRLRVNFSQSFVRPEFLLVQRKDSLFFVEFVRGKYDKEDIAYIKRMIGGMVKEEQDMLRSETAFELLWSHLWAFSNMKHCMTNEFCLARDKYNALLIGDTINRQTLVEIVASVNTCLPELEWGFPKGRRNIYENEQTCAVREFVEETGVQSNNLSVFPKSFEDVFTGSNNVQYMHKYFMARMVRGMKTGQDNDVPIRSAQQAREISCVKWMSLKDAAAKMTGSKAKILDCAHRFVVQSIDNTWKSV